MNAIDTKADRIAALSLKFPDRTVGQLEAMDDHARCKHCGHARYAHVVLSCNCETCNAHGAGACNRGADCVACGCTKFEVRTPKPIESLPLWFVEAEFLTNKGWVKASAKVRSAGRLGAIAKGLKETKKEAVAARKQIKQTKVTVTRVGRG